jgi:hypothetical protein
MRTGLYAIFMILVMGGGARLSAYPEYQEYIVKATKRPVNCAMCHTHSDGPNGTGFGQIGRLTPEQQLQLTQARSALQPGKEVNSPILNEFGNRIIREIGKEKFSELKIQPAKLAEVLKPDVDLDHDGISDVQEYLEGTHPLLKSDGNPWLLFKVNLRRNASPLVLTIAATFAGLYGLIHLLHGFAQMTRARALLAESEEEARDE